MSATRRGGSRIGVDIGGTFTDLVWSMTMPPASRVGKSLTTPGGPVAGASSRAWRRSCTTRERATADRAHAHPRHDAGHQRPDRAQGRARPRCSPREGFRDALEIGREHRYDMYDLFIWTCRRRWCRATSAARCASASWPTARSSPAARSGRGASSAMARELAAAGVEAHRRSACSTAIANPELHERAGRRLSRRDRARHPRVAARPTWCRRSASTSAPPRPWPTSTSRP